MADRPAGAAPAAQIVKVKVDGGSAGGASSQCSFTYSIYAEASSTPLDSDYLLATGLTPVQARLAIGTYETPTEGDLGEARYTSSGWQLLRVFSEIPSAGACAP